VFRHPFLVRAALSGVAITALASRAVAQQHSPPPPTDAATAPRLDRSSTVVEAIHRSGVVPRCWNAFVHQEPNSPSVQFRLRVEVTAQGTVHSVAVLDPTPESLAQCIRTQVGRLSLPTGDAITVQTGYAFSPGMTAPVPMGP
jgi:hypothetical protein